MAHIEIIVGTYEEFLLGYKVENKDNKYSLIQSFADKSHTGSLKCLAVDGQWIATGGTDDRIFVYDMKTRKQSQIILSHDGTINTLDFTPDQTHLLSGGSDGKMIATKLASWQAEGMWKKAHDGSAVTNISCHPSGKLAMSLGSDLILRSWNLVKGRVAYKTNLKSRNTLGPMPDCLSWSSNGNYFSLTGSRIIEIWSIKSAEVARSFKTKSKPVCVTWIEAEICLVGLEDGKILWIDMSDEEQEETYLEAHSGRVKAIASYKDYLVTGSSSGEIKLWQIVVGKRLIKELCSISIGCRPTCIGILDIEQFGPDYILTKTITEIQEAPVKQKVTNKNQPRGIVTIEYEDETAEESIFNKGSGETANKKKPSKEAKEQNKSNKKQKAEESSNDEDDDIDDDDEDENEDDDNDDENDIDEDEEDDDEDEDDDDDDEDDDDEDDGEDSDDKNLQSKPSKNQKRKIPSSFENVKKAKLSKTDKVPDKHNKFPQKTAQNSKQNPKKSKPGKK